MAALYLLLLLLLKVVRVSLLPQQKSSQVILGKCQDNRLTFDNSQDGKGQNYENIRCQRQ